MSALTPSQQRAIALDGNGLVIAGAGTGKTRTLVERCLARVTRPEQPTSLDRILVVTFTEAAATEVRRRIRERLQEMLVAEPGNAWLDEQLARLDVAPISTLHSFCLRLVREHFHELGLDPQLVVLADDQARALRDETLGGVLENSLTGTTPEAAGIREFLLDHDRGSDSPVRRLVQRIHDYTQTLAAPRQWFEREAQRLQQPHPAHWEAWLIEGFQDWRERWLPTLRMQPAESTAVHRCADLLDRVPKRCARTQLAALLTSILAEDTETAWPRGTRTRLRKPIESFFDEAVFLESLARPSAGTDPLAEDWAWVRGPMQALLHLAVDFSAAYARAKRDLGVVDFHDLEQLALQLLLDPATAEPSALAHAWRRRLDFLFVDEYQDINEAQDAILRALAREGPEGNRFLVGDVKQSIYRFRLANPRIFQTYAREWRAPGSAATVVDLTGNFRSRPRLIQFVNRCFEALMQDAVGGIQYAQAHALEPGLPEPDPEIAAPVEAHLLVRAKAAADEDEASSAALLSDTEREARLLGQRFLQLHEGGERVPDPAAPEGRRLAWRDMAVLLRAPRGQSETYVKVFESLRIPLTVTRAGFFASLEVTDLVSLLQVLDNPLQDLPLLAVLRSPLVGLADDQLAALRLATPRGRYWTALARAPHAESADPVAVEPLNRARDRLRSFLRDFARWRRLARQDSLSRCLEVILDDTGYEAWLATQPRGTQRQANVRRLLTLSRQFDQFQRQGLFRFLQFVALHADADADESEAATAPADAVQLLSIHQSKGLEFPVVAVAGLGRRFNLSDLRDRVILDEELGLCPQVTPPGTGTRYPSLPHWLAARRQHSESLGEELRLLYVAFTRARHRLLLAGATSPGKLERWQNETPALSEPARTLAALCALDWLGPHLLRFQAPPGGNANADEPLARLHVHDAESIRAPSPPLPANAPQPVALPPPGPETIARLNGLYPFPAAAIEPAKTSVSELRRRASDEDEESARGFMGRRRRPRTAASDRSAAEVGTAHHAFLEAVELDQTGSAGQLLAEAQRLEREHRLEAAQVQSLDLAALARFWQGDVGRLIREERAHVHRELPFTARLSPADLSRLGVQPAGGLPEGDFMVVQGVVDLAVIRPGEIWVLDFKTDQVGAEGGEPIRERYATQVQLYALALSRIYRRPVTRVWLHLLSWDDPGATLVIEPPRE